MAKLMVAVERKLGREYLFIESDVHSLEDLRKSTMQDCWSSLLLALGMCAAGSIEMAEGPSEDVVVGLSEDVAVGPSEDVAVGPSEDVVVGPSEDVVEGPSEAVEAVNDKSIERMGTDFAQEKVLSSESVHTLRLQAYNVCMQMLGIAWRERPPLTKEEGDMLRAYFQYLSKLY